MKVVIAGGGNVGKFVASDLSDRGHEIVIVEIDQAVIDRASSRIPATWVRADACEPIDMKGVGLETCDVLVAATGDDEDNLVISLLAKQEFAIPRVVARVNHPGNYWLFNESWGVDVPVSPPHLLTSLVEEAVTVGDLVRLLPFEQGRVSLVEFTLSEESTAAGKVVSELTLPRDCSLVAVVRAGHVIQPRDETPLMVGDELILLTTPEFEGALEEVLSGVAGGADGVTG